MRTLNISNDIIPIGEFKLKLAQWFNNVRTTNLPLVITQNGKPAGVLISPTEYDELTNNKLFMDSVSRGLEDRENGATLSSSDLKAQLQKIREQKQ